MRVLPPTFWVTLLPGVILLDTACHILQKSLAVWLVKLMPAQQAFLYACR